ncbi:MAG: outer membrane protein TolC [Planctomycetota bacterium]|jgi:outer membrane protein TolC
MSDSVICVSTSPQFRLWPVLAVLLGPLVTVALAQAESSTAGQATGGAQGQGRGDGLAPAIRLENPRKWRSESQSVTLSLEEALEVALRHNLGLSAAEGQTEIARLDAMGSWGAFDPVLSARAELMDREREGNSSLSGASLLEEDSQSFSSSLLWPVRTGADFSLSYARTNNRTNNQFATFDVSTTDVVTAMVTQPLLKGAWERFATTSQRQSEVVMQRTEAAEQQVRQQLLLDVYNAYWDLVSARDQLDVSIVTYELGQQQLLQDQRRLEVGAGTEVDVLQSETNLAQSWEQLLQSANSILAGEDALRELLFQSQPSESGDLSEALTGWDWPIIPSTSLPEVNADDVSSLSNGGVDTGAWRASLAKALRSRPELAQARFDVEASEVQLERSVSDRRAQLDLELTASSAGFDVDPGDAFSDAAGFDFPEYRGALVFSLPLGNRTAKNANRSARAALRNAKLAYDTRELEILSNVRGAVREVRFRAIAATAAETSRDLAERQLAAEQARQRNGLSTTFQVLEFQKTSSEARSNERAARAAYAKALAGLRFSEGVLGDDLQVVAEEQLPESQVPPDED